MSLTRAVAILAELLDEHPELAALPVDWELRQRPDGVHIWASARHTDPRIPGIAATLARALDAELGTQGYPEGEQPFTFHWVYGSFEGLEVNFSGHTPLDAGSAADARARRSR
ncbi:hypothetical protein ACQKFA_23390 [Streptomyces sp. CH6]|uniref:hypothetical protein n=1 Tax=Streptomyces sp. CH6 TaxID=3420320 RepID=UPI003D047A39